MNSIPMEGYTRKHRHIGKWICLDCGYLGSKEEFIVSEEEAYCPECDSDNVDQY